MSDSCPSLSSRPGAPALPGTTLDDIDTPALLIDLEALDANIAQVHGRVLQAGLRLRPHGKAHKCAHIAQRQIQAGAHGICCQKASEAEAFIDGGIKDVLITNEVVGVKKADRVARLARKARVAICVDHQLQVAQLAAAAANHDVTLDVLIEVDVGHGRCGVRDVEEALALAGGIGQYPDRLRFAGVHAYRGNAQHLRSPEERKAAIAAAVDHLRPIVQRLRDAGCACEWITGGGTGTYMLEAGSGLYTEVQPGSYVLMDTDYGANQAGDQAEVLRPVLFGWCTVISTRPGQAVLDGGLKAFSVDQGPPRILAEGWKVHSLSDEHTVLVSAPGAAPLAVGDKVRMLPSHCDPTVNLHDWLVACRGNEVVEVWPVTARGAVF